MTRFWHRRICEATLAVSLVIIGLYFLPYFASFGRISDSLIISDWGALLAAVTLVLSFIAYLWAPQKTIFPTALSVYLLLLATTATLILNTGGSHSSFVALWMLIAVFASVFGWWGIIPTAVGIIGYLAIPIINGTSLSSFDMVVAVVAGAAPLVVSYVIFHASKKSLGKENSAYHELANELSQISSKSDTVIKAIDDGVIALDSHGNIELMNPSAQRIIGWGNADATGLSYASVLKLSDDKSQAVTESNDPIAAGLATNKDVHTKDFYATTGGGKRILLSLTVSPIGQIGEGVIIVFRDITRESAEEREQAEFISTASHEMRTPVASIEGYLGLALNPQTATIDAKARDFIEKAHASAQHLGRLFQDLLDVSKADDGRLSNHPKVVDIVDYVGEIVEGLRPKAEEKQLRLFYKPKPDNGDDDALADRRLSPVYYANVDNDHLREVVANLVENAIKYTPKGDVVVDVTGDDDHTTISIQDSGIGIAREDLPHLFQKFYRVDNSATREIGGTGLGLYLCRRLAEVMGGRIWLDSEFGKGSTFYLELPRLDREEAIHMIDNAASEITTSSTVLTGAPLSVETSDIIDPLGVPAAAEQPSYIASAPQVVLQPIAPLPETGTTQTPPTQAASPLSSPRQPQPTLEAIEQNPSAYIQQQSSGLRIPVRGADGQIGNKL